MESIDEHEPIKKFQWIASKQVREKYKRDFLERKGALSCDLLI